MIESRLAKIAEIDPEKIKAQNEKEIWTAVKDGKIISGTLAQLRAYDASSK